MATLILGTLGQAVGQAILGPTAFSLFGASISGAAIGGAIGSALGSFIDNNYLLKGREITREGPRLASIALQAAEEGAAIPRVYGRARLAGQVIWASRFLETKTTRTQKVGGKGMGGSGQRVTETDYAYAVSFAVGLCEGEIAGIGRIWADGQPLDASGFTVRTYLGTQDQTPDAVIEAIEGSGNAPAYLGLAYVVFEDLPLESFGNRIPQLQFEVFRTLAAEGPALENLAQAVVLGPGTGEFVYATEPVFRDLGGGRSQAENVNNSSGRADVLVSLDQLQQFLPNVAAVSVVVCWIGDDLRAGHCLIKPGVEFTDKTTYPLTWSVNGITRATAHLMSRDADDRPNFGGTPADAGVVELIAELRARGIAVFLYPFLLLDIPAGNALPDPYGGASQGAFPWRGRITCDHAPGTAGTEDASAAAATAVSAFFGTATAAQFSENSEARTVNYTGTPEWSYRRFILHCAHLAHLAGGVDGFFIGSELRGLTTLRDGSGANPAVAQLQNLATEVRTVLGSGTELSYAADWSEYFGHQPADGSVVRFHLDALWMHSAIDAVAIDLYHPLSDWRDGALHADAVAGAKSNYDLTYLQGNIEGGEGFAWYYVSDSARNAQTRTAITDGAYSKPWVFRYKDIRSWWSNLHYARTTGVESGTPTAWTVGAKPIWFSELGCPALDRGANEPNVFYDAKSSESRLPHFSRGGRDDLMQRRYLEALMDYWRVDGGHNPTSGHYSGTMIDTARAFIWTWDARPYPDFPLREDVWSDGPNWRFGHWIEGRVGSVSLSALVSALVGEFADVIDVGSLNGLVAGYVVDRPMSPRAAIEPLAAAFHFDAIESEGLIRFRDCISAEQATIEDDTLVRREGDKTFEVTRQQECDMPGAARLTYIEIDAEYRPASVEARKLSGSSDRTVDSALPIVLAQPDAQGLADRLLQAAWVGRERAKFVLPPSNLALEPGDLVRLVTDTREFRFQLTRLNDGEDREVEAISFDASVFDGPPGPFRTSGLPAPVTYGRAALYFLDVPALPGAAADEAGYVAAAASPWPGRVAVYKSPSADGFTLQALAKRPAITGALLSPLYAGPLFRWDKGNTIYLEIHAGGLAAADDLSVLNGANAAAVMNADGECEIVQFAIAELVGPDRYLLSRLLRGQLGTESAMRSPVAAGAPFVLLDSAVTGIGLSPAEARLPLNYRFGPAQRALQDVSFVAASHTFAGVPQRPLARAQVRALRQSSGAILLTWVRRTRVGGDDWDAVEVALDEPSEAYDFEILNGGAVVRTVSVTVPQAIYAAADQTTDFGGPAPYAFDVRVYQVSPSYGRGAVAATTVYPG
jgi:hypothetical protein